MAIRALRMQRKPYTPRHDNGIRYTKRGGRLKSILNYGLIKYFDHVDPEGNYIFIVNNTVAPEDLDRLILELQSVQKHHSKYGKKKTF